jgi:uncharacterized phage protein (TIGR01671 family)
LREIKFRAWVVNPRRRIIGVYEAKQIMIYDFIKWSKGELFTPNDVGNQLFENADDLKIMQFTGLKDKNEKEIYEGDIVKFSNIEYSTGVYGASEGVAEIVYKNNAFILLGYDMNCDNLDANIFGYLNNNDMEVIGNIYENPELIKGDK